MELLIEGENPKKSSSSSSIGRTAPKKKVVKRVVRKVKKEPETLPPSFSEPQTHNAGFLDPSRDFSLRMGPTSSSVDLPPLDEDDNEFLATSSKGQRKPNPFSFFEMSKDLEDDQEPDSHSPLPVLSSDGEWDDDDHAGHFPLPHDDDDEDDDLPIPKPSALDMLLNLPDVSSPDHRGADPPLPLDRDDEPDFPPSPTHGRSSGGSWKERALIAERDVARLESRCLQQQDQLRKAERRIQKLQQKEKADADQMDAVLQKVEANLQQSRKRYEERLGQTKRELQNATRMIQHLTQSEHVNIPDNFDEYLEFMNAGRAKASHASEQLRTLSETAKTQVQNLLKGCEALDDLSRMLASIDRFAEQKTSS